MTTARNTTTTAAALLLGTMILLGAGCASGRRTAAPPLGPDEEPIVRVAVTPMVRATPQDVREGVGESVTKGLLKGLARRGIVTVAPAAEAGAPKLEEEDLKESSPESVRAIGPADERLVLVVFLTDWSSKITFGSTCTVEVSGYLLDKRTGRVVWHAKGNGKAGQGGLLGMAMKRASDHDAIAFAVAHLMAQFPRAVSRT